MARLYNTLLLLIIPFLLFSQAPRSFNFEKPIDLPFHLSGTFGELRPNHFHTGIDIKTNGKTGYKIKSIEDGYVSRISVSPFGYGKAVYITHPDGLTSVYAHLDKFSDKIEQYVKQQQYSQRKFALNLFPEKDEFVVNKNEEIGISGNSGSSQGPHLHFEIRETSTQKPLNPLMFDYKAPDDKKPVLKNIVLYKFPKLTSSSIYVEKEIIQSDAIEGSNKEIKVENGFLGLGIYALDYLNNSYSRNGVYKIELFVNEMLLSKIEMDTLDFSEQKYLNASIDYPIYINQRKRIQKLFKEPGNKVSIYKHLNKNDGLIEVLKDSLYNIEIIIKDFKGNTINNKFTIIGGVEKSQIKSSNDLLLKFNKQNTIQTKNFKLTFPDGSLYNDLYFNFEEKENYIELGDSQIAILKPYSLSIKIDSVLAKNKDKLSVVKIEKSNRLNYLGGKINGDEIILQSKTFGKFTLALDTIAPSINGKNIFDGKWMTKEKQLIISVKDNETGIDQYNAYIDNNWILMEYDAKKNLLIYDFSDIDLIGKKHKFTIEVNDNVGNTSSLEFNFYK